MTQSDMTAFGHYTTAREVLQRAADLTGQVALLTGGNAGEAIYHQELRACVTKRDSCFETPNLFWAATSQLERLK